MTRTEVALKLHRADFAGYSIPTADGIVGERARGAHSRWKSSPSSGETDAETLPMTVEHGETSAASGWDVGRGKAQSRAPTSVDCRGRNPVPWIGVPEQMKMGVVERLPMRERKRWCRG